MPSTSTTADALPGAPAPQTDSFAAWNALLRDVMRMGVRAASQNDISAAASGSPMDAPMPGETNGLAQSRSASDNAGPGIQTGGHHSGGMRGPMEEDSMQADGPGYGGNAGTAPSMNQGMGFHGGTGTEMGAGPMQSSSGMNRGMGGGPRGGSLNLGSLFQLAGDASRGLNASGYTGLGTALGVLPTISQLTRGGLSLPVASSVGNFRLSYQSPLTLPGMNGSTFAMHGYGSGLATYDSPHARSGRVDFSASAMMGMGSSSTGGMSGGPGGGVGGMGHGGPGGSHSGPGTQTQSSASVSLHLSF
ncbi:MAG TPA: hypothetical protein VN151_15080 [Terracidiphilus sp.]|nr:hypothetical protein [Terracidiphilus sp.]